MKRVVTMSMLFLAGTIQLNGAYRGGAQRLFTAGRNLWNQGGATCRTFASRPGALAGAGSAGRITGLGLGGVYAWRNRGPEVSAAEETKPVSAPASTWWSRATEGLASAKKSLRQGQLTRVPAGFGDEELEAARSFARGRKAVVADELQDAIAQQESLAIELNRLQAAGAPEEEISAALNTWVRAHKQAEALRAQLEGKTEADLLAEKREQDRQSAQYMIELTEERLPGKLAKIERTFGKGELYHATAQAENLSIEHNRLKAAGAPEEEISAALNTWVRAHKQAEALRAQLEGKTEADLLAEKREQDRQSAQYMIELTEERLPGKLAKIEKMKEGLRIVE